MPTPHDIQRLCETAWDSLRDATPEERRGFAERFLAMHGWDTPEPIQTRAAGVQPHTLSYRLAGGTSHAMAAHFVSAGTVTPPGVVVDRCLDFCPGTRVLVAATRALDVCYALITDMRRFYFYDARTGELLLHADTPEQYTKEFGDVLQHENAAAGSLDEIRRQPRSYCARQLREWTLRWSDRLMADYGVAQDVAWLAMDRFIVLRYLLEARMAGRPGWRIARGFAAILAKACGENNEGCGRALVSLCNDLGKGWRAGLFDTQPMFDQLLCRDEIAAPMLREFCMLSRSKFDVDTVLESFNHGDASEKARVRMIPEENPQRLALLSKQTPASIDDMRIALDLADEGYRAIFHWFDRVTELYDRLATEFEAVSQAQRDPSEDLDLFGWSEHETARPNAFADPFVHALDKGLVVYYSSAVQFRTGRLMLYLHFIRKYKQSKRRFTHFPSVEAALNPRPAVLDVDRANIYNARSEENSEWDVI